MEPQKPLEINQEPANQPLPVSEMPLPQVEQAVLSNPKKPRKNLYLILILVFLLIAGAATAYIFLKPKKPVASSATVTKVTAKSTTQTSTAKVEGLQLDASKNYGNKYANGILPVGDSKYVSDTAKAGYVYVCPGYASNLGKDQGGAGSRGPWFVNNNTQYDLNKKLKVQGSVMWQASFSNKVTGATRAIITNGLPDHATGVFPISANDPAYAYDRNPNSIKGQTLNYSLSAAPAYSAPVCMGGEVGVMLSGIPLFNAFDAGGRDAGAWEIQDSCSGHPQKDGEYHYHTLSSCIKDVSVKTVIGFALDGFPITGPQVAKDNILTTSDLDACHGLTSQVVLDGKTVTTYHYVMTQDFPYSASCFRAAAANPPNQPAKP